MSLELLNRIRSAEFLSFKFHRSIINAETFHELETREELKQLWIT